MNTVPYNANSVMQCMEFIQCLLMGRATLLSQLSCNLAPCCGLVVVVRGELLSLGVNAFVLVHACSRSLTWIEIFCSCSSCLFNPLLSQLRSRGVHFKTFSYLVDLNVLFKMFVNTGLQPLQVATRL